MVGGAVVVVVLPQYSDQFLGKVRVPLKGLTGEKELTRPLEDPDGEAQEGSGVQGQLRILLSKSS